MGYREPTITIDLSEFGDGCHITMRNPRLEALNFDEEGVDPAAPAIEQVRATHEAGKRLLTRLFVGWLMWDPDTDEELAPPTLDDMTPLDRVPSAIWQVVYERIRALRNPTQAAETAPQR